MYFLNPPGSLKEQPQSATQLDRRHWLTKDIDLAINCARPIFNSVNGRRVALTAGGSGMASRGTSKGLALYTPNGGWAKFSVNRDWSVGPNTCIMLAQIYAVDNPWGGLFSKNSTGTSSQFGVGRKTFDDTVYGAVSDTTQIFSGATVSGLTSLSGPAVLAFSHDGLSTSGMSFYLNGILVGTTPALGASLAGTGDLILGAARDQSATVDSDVDWLAFVHAAKNLTAREHAEIARNIWAPWQAPARRLWPVTGGIVTHDLTGGNSTQTNASGTAAISQTHALTVSAATSANTSSAPAITQAHILAVANSIQANAASDVAVTIGASVTLVADASIQTNAASVAAITQAHVLVHAPSIQDNIAAFSAIVQAHILAAANASQGNAAGTGAISLLSENNLVVSPVAQGNIAGTGQITRTQTLTVANATQGNKLSTGAISDGVVVEAALTTGIAPADKIKKPGIPVDAPAWLKTFLETIVGRRGNKIEVPKFQSLEFSATPTKAECEALYQYVNQVRTSVADILTRLDS